jgi:site-specific DNA recombinase
VAALRAENARLRRLLDLTPGGGRRRATPIVWAISTSLAHPALVCEADFVAVQQIRAARVDDDGVARRYLLAGLIRCGLCGRLMDAHWVNGRAGYRCRHGHNSASPPPPQRLRNLHVREDKVLIELARRLEVDGDNCAPRALDVVAHLRSRNVVTVHDRIGWKVAARDDV